MNSANPYSAPSSEIQNPQHDAEGYDESSIYSPNGRFNRSRYFVHFMNHYMLIAVLGIIAAITIPAAQNSGSGVVLIILSGLAMIAFIFIFVSWILFSIRRFHDMNRSGWWTILLLIPLVSLWPLFTKGDEGANRFGPPGRPNSSGLNTGVWIYGVLMVLGLLGNLFTALTSSSL